MTTKSQTVLGSVADDKREAGFTTVCKHYMIYDLLLFILVMVPAEKERTTWICIGGLMGTLHKSLKKISQVGI